MAVSVETPFNSYIGNGVTVIYPYEFTTDDLSNIKTYVDDVLIETGISVEIGEVVFDIAPQVGSSVVVLRATPLDQRVPFDDPQATTLEELEILADRFVRQLQEVDNVFNRVPVLPLSSTSASKAGTTLGFDANGAFAFRSSSEELQHLGVLDSFNQAISTTQANAATASASSDAASGFLDQVQSLISQISQGTFNFDNSTITFNFSTN